MSTRGKPNVLLIIADDLGRDVVRVSGSGSDRKMQVVNLDDGAQVVGELPNISLILRNGLFFDQAWAQPACSPTRASIYTGTHPWKNGIGNPGFKANVQPDNDPELDPSSGVVALPKMLPADYACGLFGKWHLGDQRGTRPTAHGWDKHVGTLAGVVGDYFNWQKYDSSDYLVSTTTTVHATRDTVNEAIAWISGVDEDRPWFVTIAFHAPHSPFHAPTTGTYSLATGSNLATNAQKFNAMAQNMDYYIGQLFGAPAPTIQYDSDPISEAQLANTIVIFVGDNGSDSAIATEEPKTTVFEGGVRIPFIIADGRGILREIQGLPYPALSPPGNFLGDKRNATTYELAHVVDLYRTIAELARSTGDFVADLDSVSLTALFTKGRGKVAGPRAPRRNHNFSQYFWKETDDTFVGTATIRNNDYKLNYDSRNNPPYQLFRYTSIKGGNSTEIPGLESGATAPDLYALAVTGEDKEAAASLQSLVAELRSGYRPDDEGGEFPDVTVKQLPR